MALQKQSVYFNFSNGVDTKSDPKQIPLGRFYDLQNSVFDKAGLLKKRNGYAALTTVTGSVPAYATTLNGNLLAVADSFYAYSEANNTWTNKGSFVSADVSVMPMLRTNGNKAQADSAIAANGLVCIAYTETDGASVPTVSYKYTIIEEATGQIIVAPTTITPTAGTVSSFPKVFLLGNYFIILFGTSLGGVDYDLQYIAIQTASPTTVAAAVTITTDYVGYGSYPYVLFDGVVASDVLYMCWPNVAGTTSMKKLTSALSLSAASTFAALYGYTICADTTGGSPIMYVVCGGSSSASKIFSVDTNLSLVTAITAFFGPVAGSPTNTSACAQNGVLTVVYEVFDYYSFGIIPKRKLYKRTYTVAGGVLSAVEIFIRKIGLASKLFISNGSIYFAGIYSSNTENRASTLTNYTTQPTLFIIDINGNVISKLVYSNSGGNSIYAIPNVTVSGSVFKFPYLVQDLSVPVVKTTPATTTVIRSQLGVNLATITLNTQEIISVELAQSISLTGGITWMYDGFKPVELGFHLWPDMDQNLDANGTSEACLVLSPGGGSMIHQAYYYQVTYEWTDNAGNIHRSSPSFATPVSALSTAAGTCSVTLSIPTLNVTAKVSPNPVRIVIYRWSTAQPIYYQVTSVIDPLLNDTTVDFVTYVDTVADSSILGNNILYTTGDVVENIGPPASSAMCIYKSRLFLVDSEDRNLIWYSKQVIDATPVEMSDLFTIYVGPSSNDNVTSGPIVALGVLDDKLIIFKENELFYLVGTGPDNTGANNDFTDPIYISSIVGCSNKKSVVKTPEGLMFQSSKGIWLLGRNMQVTYVGAPVEQYNSYDVVSSVNIVGTNQVRFAMSNDVTLVYDYFFGQWGTFIGIPMVSSTIYQGLHTFINSTGGVLQETAGQYYDGTTASPVLMSFKTSNINIAGLQGFQRAYWFNFIGDYLSAHTLTCQVAYDYAGFTQSSVINPSADDALEQWQVYFRQQKCQAVQLYVQESYDAGGTPGAGFNMSGLNIQIGVKGQSPKLKQTVSVG